MRLRRSVETAPPADEPVRKRVQLLEYAYSDGSTHLAEGDDAGEQHAKELIGQPDRTYWDSRARLYDDDGETVGWGAAVLVEPDGQHVAYDGVVLVEVRGLGARQE